YWSDDGDLFAIRIQDWKVHFIEQNHTGIAIWREGFNKLRAPKLFNLRADPFERGDSSLGYDTWFFQRAFAIVPAQAIVARWLDTFKEFPIRQKPASFNLDEVMSQLGAPQPEGVPVKGEQPVEVKHEK